MAIIRKAIVLLVLLAASSGASAHHSRAEYTAEVSELQGELIEFTWRNPHPRFTLRILNDNGEEELWRIEGYGSLYTLGRGGVTGELFEIGQTVRLAGQLSTRRPQRFLARHILLADGSEIVLRGDAEPYFSDQHVGGHDSWAADEEALSHIRGENRGIFRIWSHPHRRSGVTTRRTPFTEAALDARTAWDAMTDTSMHCVPKGMPFVMTNPHPFKFVDNGAVITLTAHEFSVVRTIHMEDADNPEDQAPSHTGYSVGYWEGNTLIVETSRISWPTFDSRTPQSEAVEVVERFTVSDDQTRLDYHMTVTDPATFTEPATTEKYWLALGETLEPYTCIVDVDADD